MESSKSVRVAVGLALALLLSGCPYESTGPLAPVAGATLDTALIGPWQCHPADGDDKPIQVRFTAFDRHQYVLILQMPDESPAAARAHVVKLRNANFLSLQLLEDKSGQKWASLRYALDNDELKLRFVADKLLSGAKTPTEMRARIAKNLDNPELYEPGYACTRVPPK